MEGRSVGKIGRITIVEPGGKIQGIMSELNVDSPELAQSHGDVLKSGRVEKWRKAGVPGQVGGSFIPLSRRELKKGVRRLAV